MSIYAVEAWNGKAWAPIAAYVSESNATEYARIVRNGGLVVRVSEYRHNGPHEGPSGASREGPLDAVVWGGGRNDGNV